MRRTAAGAAIALALLALLGFFVAPPIARHQLERALSDALHRPVTIERVRLNPFTLSATIDKLVVAERGDAPAGGEPLFSFDALHANVAASSLVRLAPVIERVRLTRPHLRLTRFADGRYNVQDLVDEASAAPAQPKPAAEPPRFAVFNIELDDGRIDFDDRPEKARHAVTDLRIGVPFLSSIPSEVDITVQPELRAKINGAPVGLAGATKPFKDTHETTVSLELRDLELAKYLVYSPVPLAVRVPSGRLDTQLTLSLSLLREKLHTLTVAGSAKVRDLVVQQPDGTPMVTLASLAVELDAFDAVARQVNVRSVALERPDVRAVRRKDGSINLLALVAAGGGTTATGTQPADAKRQAAPAPRTTTAASPAAGTGSPRGGAAAGGAFALRIDAVSVSGGIVRFADEMPDKPFQVRLDNVTLAAAGLAYGGQPAQTEKPATLKLAFDVEPKGRFTYTGTLQPAPLATEGVVALDGLRIAAFAPYYAPFIDVAVTGGELSTKGTVAVDLGATPPRVAYRGDAAVAGLASRDGPTSQELLRWKSLQVSGIDFRLEPLAVSIGQVALADFYSRLIVNADGTLNLQGLVRRRDGAPAGAAGSGAAPVPATRPAAAAATPASTSAAPKVRIGRIALKGGTVNFSDYFVRPNYSAELLGVAGSVSEMSADKSGDVHLRGRIGATAPIEIAGRINALASSLYLDIEASARGVELPGLTPYSVKYAGYGIEKGKLSMQVKYRLENRRLVAENNVRLDQLTFGPRVESPTATQLPVLLAVALLKDRNGVIDLDLPVSGSLDDPQFSVAGVIGRVLVSLVTKAVTAPFALLGALFGGGEQLSYVEFAPGATRVSEAGDAKLRSLAKALEERPGLRLDVAGRADPDADRDALRRARLERQLKALKLRDTAARQPATKREPPARSDASRAAGARPGSDRKTADADAAMLDDVTLEPAEYERLLALAWRTNAATPGAASVPARATDDAARDDRPATAGVQAGAKQPPRAEMEQQLLARLNVSDDELQALAGARATAIRDWLVDTAKIAPERIFVVAPRLGAEGIEDGGRPTRVDFAVK